ncbi:secreted protein NIS1 [Microthyrium microscopicum]|uniref:Secreted protein NIS1 n=1 Tax=Microthyrium microscopicum TaxID=703497 RepID=A0A6A6U1I7_9PEZI|nr:secreted protein NIS1 [Microthyrium microscopicum]
MQITTLLIAAATAAVASARIDGIAVPQTIKPGDGFNARILTENYIQSVYDVATAFGVAPGSGFEGSLGTVIGSFYLGPEQSNVLGNITKWVTLPNNTPAGKAVISASFFSLYGAGAAPTIETHNVTITVGDSTSTTYVSSFGGVGS